MLISHKHQFIFLKTQKTAGTSVEIALSRLLTKDDVVTPISWRWPFPSKDDKLRKSLGYQGPTNFLSNVFEYKAIDIKYLLSKGKLKRHFYSHMPAEAVRKRVPEDVWNTYKIISIERNPFDKAISSYYWFTRKLEIRPSLNEYVADAPPKRLSNWSIYSICDTSVVDFMIRFESLEEGLAELQILLGIQERIELPRVKTKNNHRLNREPWQSLLNEDSIARLRSICRHELMEYYPDI